MASYHFSAQIIGRAKGRSAIAASAYRAGVSLRELDGDAVHDFRRRRGVVHQEIMLPEGAAPWLADRERLWNHVHQLERRRDAQLAREINLALPHELTAEARLTLIRGFIREQFISHGMVADLAVHAPSDNDPRNHHAHVMLTLRKATSDGLYRVKTREWNADALLRDWRAAWAEAQNRALVRDHHQARVDHRTLVEQRAEARAGGQRALAATLDRQPEIHIGPRAQKLGQTQRPPPSRPRAGSGRKRADGAPARTVDYPRIDEGPRLAFNAAQVRRNAGRLAQELARVHLRTARLRLSADRALRRYHQAEDSLRELQRQQGLPRGQRSTAGLFARHQTLWVQQRSHALRRQQLIRQLLGRLDRMLAELNLVEERTLQRSQTLLARSLGRTPLFARGRAPGEGGRTRAAGS